jgi:hypothetical protein
MASEEEQTGWGKGVERLFSTMKSQMDCIWDLNNPSIETIQTEGDLI